MSAAAHTAVVGSLGYRERLAALPPSFEATLVPEPGRYFLHAIAVHGPSGKIGYLAPEASRSRFDAITAAAAGGAAVVCPARLTGADRSGQGAIEIVVDLSRFPLSA